MAPSDPTLALVAVAPVYDPTNPRHTERELLRYQKASVRSLVECQNLSVCGPDGVKVGTDLVVNFSAFMNQSTGVTSIAVPQESVF